MEGIGTRVVKRGPPEGLLRRTRVLNPGRQFDVRLLPQDCLHKLSAQRIRGVTLRLHTF